MKNSLFKFGLIAASIVSTSSVFSDTFQYRHPISGVKFTPSDPAPSGASKIACGYAHCYALVGDAVWSVGRNDYGQLGLGDTTNRSTFTKVVEPFKDTSQ